MIDGIAGSSDGKGLGLTAPRKEGQKRALERAYWQAGVLPAEIGLVEAHGGALERVLGRCSLLAAGRRLDDDAAPVPAGVTVDVLPPFAGG